MSKLQKAIDEKGVSQKSLAKAAGISTVYLCQLANGEKDFSRVSLALALRIADALEITDLRDLVDYEGGELAAKASKRVRDSFLRRVVRERMIDTDLYRYAIFEKEDNILIRRIPIDELDTTAALTDWETVAIVGEGGAIKKV